MRSLSMLSSLAKADVLFSHRVDLTGQTGLFAAGSVLVVHMAGSGLIDRLACNCKDRCFDIRQVTHPLVFISTIVF